MSCHVMSCHVASLYQLLRIRPSAICIFHALSCHHNLYFHHMHAFVVSMLNNQPHNTPFVYLMHLDCAPVMIFSWFALVEIFDTGYGNRRYSEVLAVFITVKNFSRLTDTPTNHFKVTNFLFAPKGPKGPKMVLKSTLTLMTLLRGSTICNCLKNTNQS